MPKITDISRQVNRSGRFSIFVDGHYSFPLTDLELSTSGLRIGQELSEAELDQYKSQSNQTKVYEQALRYLSYRARSESEVRSHLKRRGYSPAEIDQIIERLKAQTLLDDQKFSQAWISNRSLLKPRSRRVLELELRRKGVSSTDVEISLANQTETEERQALEQILEKKAGHYQDRAKLINYLMRQGFEYQLIKAVLEKSD